MKNTITIMISTMIMKKAKYQYNCMAHLSIFVLKITQHNNNHSFCIKNYSDPFFSVCFLAALAPFLAAVLAAALVLVFLTDPLGRPLPLLAAGADSVLVGAMLSEK